METILTQRKAEELMMKLLLYQLNDLDKKHIIDIFNQSLIQTVNYSLYQYCNKHIKTYCINNIDTLITYIKSTPSIYNDSLLSSLYECKTKDISELYKMLKKEQLANKTSILKYSNDILIKYTRRLLAEWDCYTPLNPSSFNLRFLFKRLTELDSDNNENENNTERIILTFINDIYTKSSVDNKKFLLKRLKQDLDNKDEHIANNDAIRKRNKEIFDTLKFLNEKNGTPVSTNKNDLPLEIINKFQFDVTVQSPFDKPITKTITVFQYTNLYELLTILMIKFKINIDLWYIQYAYANSNANQNSHKTSLFYSHKEYLHQLSSIFNSKDIKENIIKIDLLITPNDPNILQTCYYNGNRLNNNVIDALKILFQSHKDIINVNDLFDFISNEEFQKAKKRLFKGAHAYTTLEPLLAILELKSNEAFMLLHLLIGFTDSDSEKPYLRNVFPNELIRKIQLDEGRALSIYSKERKNFSYFMSTLDKMNSPYDIIFKQNEIELLEELYIMIPNKMTEYLNEDYDNKRTKQYKQICDFYSNPKIRKGNAMIRVTTQSDFKRSSIKDNPWKFNYIAYWYLDNVFSYLYNTNLLLKNKGIIFQKVIKKISGISLQQIVDWKLIDAFTCIFNLIIKELNTVDINKNSTLSHVGSVITSFQPGYLDAKYLIEFITLFTYDSIDNDIPDEVIYFYTYMLRSITNRGKVLSFTVSDTIKKHFISIIEVVSKQKDIGRFDDLLIALLQFNNKFFKVQLNKEIITNVCMIIIDSVNKKLIRKLLKYSFQSIGDNNEIGELNLSIGQQEDAYPLLSFDLVNNYEAKLNKSDIDAHYIRMIENDELDIGKINRIEEDTHKKVKEYFASMRDKANQLKKE